MLPDNGGAALFDKRMKGGVANPAMFFRRWLADPLQIRSIIPSPLAAGAALVWAYRQRGVRHSAGAGAGGGAAAVHRRH
jgi:hypothetical protein